jgi:hypothetical protein
MLGVRDRRNSAYRLVDCVAGGCGSRHLSNDNKVTTKKEERIAADRREPLVRSIRRSSRTGQCRRLASEE